MQDSAARMNSNPPAAPHTFPFAHGILFTGHMIDHPDRAIPRFPARAEFAARAAIHDALRSLSSGLPAATVGIAGGACGGDILFHESCADLGIPTRMLLALPPNQFAERSVAHGGANWVDRFHSLLQRLGPDKVLVMTLSDGRLEGHTANIWQRANIWMIEEVLCLAPDRILLALWDGKKGDGPGGTEHLIHLATRHGVHPAPVISTESLID